jgi:hypothetical protein
MTKELNRPLPESYWVLPGRLLAGEYPGAYDDESTRKRLDVFLEAGFDTFIDLTQPDELVPYAGLLSEQARAYGVKTAYYRFPIGDFGLPTVEQMNALLHTIDEALDGRRTIYLHCWGGIGRTGTTVGCYLVRHGRAGSEALAQLATWWKGVPKSRYHPHSPENSRQMDFVLHWAEHDQTSGGTP